MIPIKGSLFDDQFREEVIRLFQQSNQETHETLIELTDHYFNGHRDLELVCTVDREYSHRLRVLLENKAIDSKLFQQFKAFLMGLAR